MKRRPRDRKVRILETGRSESGYAVCTQIRINVCGVDQSSVE